MHDWHDNALLGAAVTAFAHHYPLELRPDHLWLMVLQGIARHVEVHSEQLRGNFVNHLGKKELVVQRDNFVLGSAHNDWEGVFPEFVAQIEANTKAAVVPTLEARFSTTTPLDVLAGKVTIMDVCKSFFEYTMMTCCGFPSVTLHGTKADWQQLQAKTTAALALCEQGFAKTWGAVLQSVLEKFVEVGLDRFGGF